MRTIDRLTMMERRCLSDAQVGHDTRLHVIQQGEDIALYLYPSTSTSTGLRLCFPAMVNSSTPWRTLRQPNTVGTFYLPEVVVKGRRSAVCLGSSCLSRADTSSLMAYLIEHTHIDPSGEQAVQPSKMVHRKCTARLYIWYPADPSDQRAIIRVTGSHNHPTPLPLKLTQDGREAYQRAIDAVGVLGTTVGKIDRGMI